ncbi:hypothetical protein T02_14102 [Trichinella nativa]|uniref:Uncharacterized protein n=1 Tax=Trichinella nativa TaxID=6335 RepID=A0A0V1KUA9_9BILA|nr:hypothetical protein T02_14102 [Trichinella nativa]
MKKIKKKFFNISQLCTITSEPFNDFHFILVGKNFDHASKLFRTSYFIGTIATYQICQFFNTASKLLQKDVDVDAALPVEHVDFHSFFVTTFNSCRHCRLYLVFMESSKIFDVHGSTKSEPAPDPMDKCVFNEERVYSPSILQRHAARHLIGLKFHWFSCRLIPLVALAMSFIRCRKPKFLLVVIVMRAICQILISF